MKKKQFTPLLLVAMLATVVSGAGQDAQTLAAKKPVLSQKKLSMEVGETAKVSVKNAKKKSKTTWKTSNKKVLKIVRKKTKGNAYAVVKGAKKGKASLTAVYKVGKTSRKLKCTVTISAKKAQKNKNTSTPLVPNEPTATPIATPIITPTATTTATPTITATPSPSATPTITASPTPTATTNTPATATPTPTWVTTWGTAEEKCDITDNAMPQMALEDSTIRQIIKVTSTGEKIRFRLSNQYGGSDVNIKSMHIAKQVTATSSQIDTATDTVITVDGKEDFAIPKGKVIQTDEITFSVNALENIAISIYFGSTPTTNITGHRGARATTYQVSGNNVSTETFTSPKTTTSWFFLADASLLTYGGSRSVVCFGDSITDGYGTDATYLGKKPDRYTRWGDYFAKRLQENEKTKTVSVINEGIGGNSILNSWPTDAGKDRFSRDLLEHDGVAYCIILFGVNDLDKLANTNKYNSLLPEYKKMVQLCHDNGIKVYGAPILPFGTSSYYSDASEEVRQMINNWMRSSESKMDGIIDFESAVADPANPQNLLSKYTHSDGLHPYDGYKVMAEAIDLSMFE